MTAVAIVPETLQITTSSCRLGTVLVARSERGVCAIHLGDSVESVRAEFEASLPAGIRAVDAPELLRREMGQVLDLLHRADRPVEFPLDLRGTPFQLEVWAALRQVPSGATISYLELAYRIGRPEAVRAVAQACAANPLAVAVPCHRAVRSDGALAGYRWGLERKQALLAAEGAV